MPQKKKPARAGFFSTEGREELLLDFFSSSLGGVCSGINSIAGSLGSFRASSSGVSSRSSSVGSRSGRGFSSRSSRSGFGSRCFLRLRAGGEGGGEQCGDEEGLFHFGFLG